MKSPAVTPAFVVPGKSVDSLSRLPRNHAAFDERFLQELLMNHPELLPVSALRDDAGSLICIGREVPVASGAIDNLYLSTAGYPVIVETKLWRNPQARREVLSQTLDYIKEVVKKDFDWFIEQRKLFCQQQAGDSSDLIAKLNELSAEELDESFLVDRVHNALARGDVLAMIVGDGIETRLQELVTHLCRDSAHLRYSLALVELACYQFNQQGEANQQAADGMIVVPRIVQDVEPVQRAYVRVDFAEGLAGQLKVTPVDIPKTDASVRTRISLNEEDFLDAVTDSAGRNCRNQIQEFSTDLIESFELEPDYKASALMLKVPHPLGDGVGVSILALEKQGRIYNTKHMNHQLKRWGFSPKKIEEITSDYWCALHRIDARFNPEGIVHLSPRQFLPFAEIADKKAQIKDQVGKVAAAIRAAFDELL